MDSMKQAISALLPSSSDPNAAVDRVFDKLSPIVGFTVMKKILSLTELRIRKFGRTIHRQHSGLQFASLMLCK